jgi:hypothetical protein
MPSSTGKCWPGGGREAFDRVLADEVADTDLKQVYDVCHNS